VCGYQTIVIKNIYKFFTAAAEQQSKLSDVIDQKYYDSF
jgi:hypothetical protein